MAAGWDRRSPEQMARLRDALLVRQLREAVAPFSPFWREQLAALGLRSAQLRTAAELRRLPAVGERDLCVDGDPAGAARLVLQADEEGWGLHAPGPALRRGMAERLLAPASYRRRVEAAIRPVSYHLGGLALSFPVASTRGDLELVARAGARAWSVLGLGPADVLVSALPADAGLVAMALPYAALGAGAPAFHVAEGAGRLLGYVPATVLALARVHDVAGLLDDHDLATVRTVVVPGPVPPGAEQELAGLLPKARLLSVWGPPDGRVLYAWCPEGGRVAGWHTYPDLEVLELVDPASGSPAGAQPLEGVGELVLTQLGFYGSALVRWRTGAVLAEPAGHGRCPGCGRTVPRLPADLDPTGTVPLLGLDGARPERVDLRAVAAALAGRADLTGWRLELGHSARDGSEQLVVAIGTAADPAQASLGVVRDIRAAAGVTPSQVVLDPQVPADGALVRAAPRAPAARSRLR